MCYDPALVRDEPLGAPASMKLVNCQYMSWLNNVKLFELHKKDTVKTLWPDHIVTLF